MIGRMTSNHWGRKDVRGVNQKCRQRNQMAAPLVGPMSRKRETTGGGRVTARQLVGDQGMASSLEPSC